MDVNLPVYVLVFVSFLTWVVFLVTLAKLSRFFIEFTKFRLTNDAELNSQVWHVKRLESEIAEIIVELRRSNKLLYEMRGAGEFPDELPDFSRDSDVFRQEKVTGQKTKPVQSALASVEQESSPPPTQKAAGKPSVLPPLPTNLDIRFNSEPHPVQASSPPSAIPDETASDEFDDKDENEVPTDTSIINFSKKILENAGSMKVGKH